MADGLQQALKRPMPDLQPWFEMLGGGTEGTSRCSTRPSPAAHAVKTEEERERYRVNLHYWHEFCQRVRQGEIAVTCVLDFAYADRGKGCLNLTGDDKMLERLYCFQYLKDEGRRVILKVHTLLKWGERGKELYQRASKVTAAKFLYADWNADEKMFKMNQESVLKLMPVSGHLQRTWRDTYREGCYTKIEWEWREGGSMPSAEFNKLFSALPSVVSWTIHKHSHGPYSTGVSLYVAFSAPPRPPPMSASCTH